MQWSFPQLLAPFLTKFSVLFENSQKFLKNAQKHKLDPFERHEFF